VLAGMTNFLQSSGGRKSESSMGHVTRQAVRSDSCSVGSRSKRMRSDERDEAAIRFWTDVDAVGCTATQELYATNTWPSSCGTARSKTSTWLHPPKCLRMCNRFADSIAETQKPGMNWGSQLRQTVLSDRANTAVAASTPKYINFLPVRDFFSQCGIRSRQFSLLDSRLHVEQPLLQPQPQLQ
jgi:hypothetical protein